jgi:hypothetical protein
VLRAQLALIVPIPEGAAESASERS